MGRALLADPAKLAQMGEVVRGLARPRATDEIGEVLRGLKGWIPKTRAPRTAPP